MDTRNSLGIFWSYEVQDDDIKNNYHVEVDGLIFYGYWKEEIPENIPSYDSFVNLWTEAEVKAKLTKWDSDDYRCYSVDIQIVKWPNDSVWEDIIRKSLLWFCARGALISWCGTEDCSPSIDIFDNSSQAGNIYAAYAPSVGFKCNSALYERYKVLDVYQLKLFRELLN